MVQHWSVFHCFSVTLPLFRSFHASIFHYFIYISRFFIYISELLLFQGFPILPLYCIHCSIVSLFCLPFLVFYSYLKAWILTEIWKFTFNGKSLYFSAGSKLYEPVKNTGISYWKSIPKMVRSWPIFNIQRCFCIQTMFFWRSFRLGT